MGVIYKITSPSGRIYIGKSKNIKKRIKDYKYQSKTRKSIIHDSIRGYGWDAHKIEIIEECADELLSEREIFWIKELKSYWLDNKGVGMNMTRGGEAGGGSWIWDVERRKRQSDKFRGEGGTFYGKKHTEETKKYIGELAKRRNLESGIKVPEWGAEKARQKRRNPVIAYDSKGNFICEFESLNMASSRLQISRASISDSLKFGSWVNGNYLFKYKTDNYPIKIQIGEIKLKTQKRPVLILTPEYEIVCEHESAQEASEFWGIPKTTINRAAMYNWLKPIRTGHVFIYTDLYNKIMAEEAA